MKINIFNYILNFNTVFYFSNFFKYMIKNIIKFKNNLNFKLI